MNHKHKISRNSYKTQNEVEHLSETYFKMSQQYNEVKEQSHNEALELDRLKTQEAHIKDEHEEFEFEKNDGYQSENSRITLTEKQERLTIIQGKLKQLETDIERYTQLSKRR